MKTLGLYRVTGRQDYRGHAPGSEFEAQIPANPERRAIDRGDIVLLARVEARLPDEFCLPDGWTASHREE